MVNMDMPPQPWLVKGNINNLDSRIHVNNRQSLPKVTNKHDSDPSKQRDMIDMLTVISEQISESVIQGFWTIMVLHRSFIPYDELCLLKNIMEILIPSDITGGRIIDGNRNFEARMGSATAMEQKGCNGRRGNAQRNVAIGTNSSSNGVTDMVLSTTSCMVKEEDPSLIVLDQVDDFVKGKLLLRVKAR